MLKGRQICRGSDIAEGDANISQETPSFDPFDRRIAEHMAKLRVSETQIISERELGYRSLSVERCFPGNFCEAVPRTGVEAIIAAEDPIAHKRSQVGGNRALQLNGEVGNATTRIQLVGRGDCAGWARLDATLARPAPFFRRHIGRKFDRGQNLSEKKPCARFSSISIVLF